METTRIITDEELLNLPKDGNKYEVVDGELRMSPAGWPHEVVVVELISVLAPYVRARQLGQVLGSNALYVLPSGNKRGPDVSFVRAGRLPAGARATPFPKLAPDLAVEVVSPSDTTRTMLDKVGEYLQAGVPLVWVIDPVKRTAAVYRSLTDVHQLDENGALEGEDVVPGFSCRLRDILGTEATS